mmetsp:Transcript_10429/g.17508  ORF Transcript_10429/g.17508 Transcript_10429/m.17508 type:complete len:288 (-) Transcript_10429:120-983(-)|eukprot:CAMPEP_0168623934 /NCGR_PEP_ID=MMETSP0449_2-20121227/9111_1 /TAXON_ID=1082188 /ORGANISM="Strombidium rassoulzadegani, Strain ras09" /LENGTH=287 /DNA_ID=CAMNT_0008665391 /DNA_START=310 /DNA_END=1173 /DNA_ORIENTATION=-
MVIFADASHDTAGHVVLEVTVKSLVLAVLDLEVCKVAAAVLGGQGPLLEVDVGVLLLLLGIDVVAGGVDLVAILIIEGAVGGVVRYLAHALRVDRHGLVGFLSHPEDLAHLGGRGGCAADSTPHILLDESVLLPQLLEVGVLKGLGSRHSVVVVVDEEFGDEVARILILRNQFGEACALLLGEVELHVAGHLLKLVQQLLLGSPQDVVDLVNLVQLVGAREERGQGQHLEKDAAHAPVVHLVVVVSIGEEALGRSVPPGRDVFGEGWFRVDAPAGAEVGQLDDVARY